MKPGLIRLTDEKDIFYDSIEKVYRYRMHCPYCGAVAQTCRCYQDLDKLLWDIDEGIADYTDTSKCALLGGEWDELKGAIKQAGYKEADVKDLTEEQAREVFEILTEDADLDYPGGEECEI